MLHGFLRRLNVFGHSDRLRNLAGFSSTRPRGIIRLHTHTIAYTAWIKGIFRLFVVLAIGWSFPINPALASDALVPGTDQLVPRQTGKISFETYDAPNPDFWYAIYSGSFRYHRQVISGILTFPSGGSGKVPAIVIMHDSAGIQTNHERAWAKFYNKLGYAAFVVDSFGGRSVKSTWRDQDKVTEDSMVIDAFQALKLLATHPNIDRNKIAITGYSKGAVVAYYTSWRFYQKRLSLDHLKFAAHLPLYAWCNIQEENPILTGAPILFLSGGKDTYTPAAPCSRFAANAKSAGVNARIIVYPNAQHSFDDPSSPPTRTKNGWNSAACRWTVNYENDHGFQPNYEGPWQGWSQFDAFWKSCFHRGTDFGYNKAVAEQAHVDSKNFLKEVLGQ